MSTERQREIERRDAHFRATVEPLERRVAELEAENAELVRRAKLKPVELATMRLRVRQRLDAQPKRELGDSYRRQIERRRGRGEDGTAQQLEAKLAELIEAGEAL